MVILNLDMIFFILVLLESGDVITKKQRHKMMKYARQLELNTPLSEASSKILDIIKEKKNKE